PTLPSPGVVLPLPGKPPANNLENTLGGNSDSDIWRNIRRGTRGYVSLPNRAAGVMIQSEGENWRSIRNGPVARYGWWLLAAVIALLGLFFAFRGRIRIDAGPSGRTIERFNAFERFVHWMTAGSFVVLALTGLNMLYGRYLFAMDPAGDVGNFGALHTAFAAITYYGKLVHNFIGFSFAVGVVLMIVIWIRHNLPDKYDLAWIAKGGGLFSSGVHPPSGKFNAGQKLVFWIVVLAGGSAVWSGIALMFPYQITPFAETFSVLNTLGFDLPTDLTPLLEMQLAQVWHTIIALVFIAVIIGHIYIGTLGMEGAFDAMGTGHVDENWAREHHNMWVAEVKGEAPPDGGPGPAGQPAE
ncbi:MAG: formate dehydrogenase subunit gamma, partial [Alphaproteobacteria bacterium]